MLSPIRLFRCDACGHKMRFGAARCGYCQRPTRLMNRIPVLVAAILIGLGLILVVLF